MWALDQPCPTRGDSPLERTPRALLVGLAVGAAVTAALVELAVLPPHAMSVAGATAGHGALLATALAWARAGATAGLVAAALIGLAAAAAAAGAGGAVAYVAPALWVVWLARRGRLTALGLGRRVAARGLVTGALAGATLAAHLLVTVSRTHGVQVHLDRVAVLVGAVAYDVGANVLGAECFFRGALFNQAQRRWSFAVAAALSTVGYVLRYLVDPLLPKSADLIVGAMFYLALLGTINCWLLWWSQSLVPGLVSALVFFAVYRTLGVS
jgi:membrane protease YdiL (CAAX protease family)